MAQPAALHETRYVLLSQDTDSAYMTRMELEAKLDCLTDEIEFLRSIYDMVMYHVHTAMGETDRKHLKD